MDLRVFAVLLAVFGMLVSDLPINTSTSIVHLLPHMQLWQQALHLLRMAAGG